MEEWEGSEERGLERDCWAVRRIAEDRGVSEQGRKVGEGFEGGGWDVRGVVGIEGG